MQHDGGVQDNNAENKYEDKREKHIGSAARRALNTVECGGAIVASFTKSTQSSLMVSSTTFRLAVSVYNAAVERCSSLRCLPEASSSRERTVLLTGGGTIRPTRAGKAAIVLNRIVVVSQIETWKHD
jgi:hypothetical protein